MPTRAAGPAPRTPEETVRSFALPQGFAATVFAGEPAVVQPIGFCFDDRGRLWVAENLSYPNWQPPGQGRDRITIFEDTDGDGRHDRRTVFYDRLNYVTGLEVGFGGVFVVSAPNLLFIPDRDGDDRPDSEPVVLLDGFGHQGVHNLVNGCTWGPDGWLYGGHGGSSFGDIGRPGAPDGERTFFDGGVWRYHPTKHVFESVLEGTTNPWGIDFDDYGQAFISNSVTPHLYHVIPGGHVERRRESPLSKHAYAVIDTIADHKHWTGADWTQSRGGTPQQTVLGGGHAHGGMMVYLGGAWPDRYRNTLFMNNIHGDRVNNDLPERKASGFVARHGADFLTVGDPWFQGLALKYGPDGAVYLSDWYDTGECHTKNPDQKTGRIYKITYTGNGSDPRLAARPQDRRLPDLSPAELVNLQLDRNDWSVGHARRLLQERAGQAGPDPQVTATLTKILDEHPDVTRKLRALWALHATGALSESKAIGLLSHPDEYVRAWAVQLLAENKHPSPAALDRFNALAANDHSPVVRLYLASAAQRLPAVQRWPVLERLARHGEDASDPNLPLMVWYALEPMVTDDPARALALASQSKLPRLREFVARRIAEGKR